MSGQTEDNADEKTLAVSTCQSKFRPSLPDDPNNAAKALVGQPLQFKVDLQLQLAGADGVLGLWGCEGGGRKHWALRESGVNGGAVAGELREIN